MEDLVQVGTIGLINAVDRYEPERGVALSAFAVPNILGEIKRHLRDRCGPIRVPRRYQETSARMRSTRWQLAARLQRNPTAAELAAAANLNEGELDEAIRAEQARTPLSLAEAGPAVSAGEIFDARHRRLPPGAHVEARIGETVCAVATTRRINNFTGFSIDVVGPDSIPGCAIGATITFRVDGRDAHETAVNQAGQGATLNLSLP